MEKQHKTDESGAAMAEYAIVASVFMFLFTFLLNPLQDSELNLIYGFSKYFSRITDFVGLPIP